MYKTTVQRALHSVKSNYNGLIVDCVPGHCGAAPVRRLHPHLLLAGFLAVLFTLISPISGATTDPEDARAVARLYSAAFDREPVSQGLNFWIDSLEQGRSLQQIAAKFHKSPEFSKKYGTMDAGNFVRQLYRNVLGREGAQGGVSFWKSQVETSSSQALVLLKFSDSPENRQKTQSMYAEMRQSSKGGWTYEPYSGSLSGNSPVIATAARLDRGASSKNGAGGKPEKTYSVGGSLDGLSSDARVTVQNKSGDLSESLTLDMNAGFAFPNKLSKGSTYAVTVTGSSEGLNCDVRNGAGTIARKNVNNIVIICESETIPTLYNIGGTVSGLEGSVTLQNNGGENLTLSNNGDFNFVTPLETGAKFAVAVVEQPGGQNCGVSDATGTVAATDVASVLVTCAEVPVDDVVDGGPAALTFNGKEWFVKNGETGPGTEALPFGSIQQALEVAQPGDGISILPGTYSESLSTERNGFKESPIVIQAREGRGTVTITTSGRVLNVDHAHHHFSQLVFSGQYGASDLIKVRTEADGWMLHNSEVKESSRDCIDMDSPSNITIRESEIHHCLNAASGRTDAHGIVGASVRGLLVKNTKVHSFSGDAFQIDSGRTSPGWDNVVIEGSEFWLEPLPESINGFSAGVVPGENAVDTKVRTGYRPKLTIRDSTFWGYRNGLISNMSALNLKESVDVTVDAVTIYDSDIGFRLRYPADVQITNAIVHSTNRAVRYEDNITRVKISNSTFGKGIGTFFQKASSDATAFDIQNSLILSNSFPIEVDTGKNQIVMDGDFRDVSSHNYTLDQYSPAVDSASDIGISTDRYGTERPLGSGIDMGAVESH